MYGPHIEGCCCCCCMVVPTGPAGPVLQHLPVLESFPVLVPLEDVVPLHCLLVPVETAKRCLAQVRCCIVHSDLVQYSWV
jgi:hypothetical protein